MDFGRVNNVSDIDFSLPQDHADNASVLTGKRNTDLEIYVGCPIWSHKDWVGKIYPAKAKDKDFLMYYAQQYNSIELNATHYKIPSLSTIARWVADVPIRLSFVQKYRR